MAIKKSFPRITQAIDNESLAWLDDNAPDLADAIRREVKGGAKPEEIRRFVMRLTQRDRLAARCEQAARAVAGQDDA